MTGTYSTDGSPNWHDIVDFEVFPVMTSREASERLAPYL